AIVFKLLEQTDEVPERARLHTSEARAPTRERQVGARRRRPRERGVAREVGYLHLADVAESKGMVAGLGELRVVHRLLIGLVVVGPGNTEARRFEPHPGKADPREELQDLRTGSVDRRNYSHVCQRSGPLPHPCAYARGVAEWGAVSCRAGVRGVCSCRPGAAGV